MQLANRNPVACFNAAFLPVVSLHSVAVLSSLLGNLTAEDGPALYALHSNQVAKDGRLKPSAHWVVRSASLCLFVAIPPLSPSFRVVGVSRGFQSSLIPALDPNV